MDFSILPPEINSTLIYTGPGSITLSDAATAWAALSEALAESASAHSAALATLGDSWKGPASAAALTAGASFTSWLTSLAALCGQTASAALSAVSAFETVFMETVPPEMVAANRAQLAELIATDVMGINLPAIALTEAEYGYMWAQDASAMAVYELSSYLSYGELQPIASAMHAVTGQLPSSSAPAAATSISAGSVESALEGLVSNPVFSALSTDVGVAVSVLATAIPTTVQSFIGGHDFFPGQAPDVLPITPRNAPSTPTPLPVPTSTPMGLSPAPVSQTALASGRLFSPAVESGSALRVGALTVPASWSTSDSHTNAPLAALPAGAGPAARRGGGDPRYGSRLTVMGRCLSGG